MSIATHLEDQTDGARLAGAGFVTVLHRTQRMGRARRHTLRVRVLRVLLPLTSVLLVTGYASTVLKTSGVGDSLPQISIPRIIPEELAMANPHYEGFGKDGATYVLDSKTAQQDPTNLKLIKLIGITGSLVQLDKSKTLFSATRGDYDSTSKVLELYEKIDVASQGGFKATLTRATLTAKDNILVSKEPVSVEFIGGTVRSNTMTLRHKAHEVTFADNVVARMIPQNPSTTKGLVADAAAAVSANQMFAASDAPLDITSARLDVKDAQQTAVFTGNVKAIQNDQSLQTPELTVTYDGASLPTATPAAAADATSPGGKIKRIVAKGPVVMLRGVQDRVTADAMEFDATSQTGSLIGNVIMQSGIDRQAMSERLDLDQAADTALLTGNVTVLQGQNQLKGGRLFINRKDGTTLLTSPPSAGSGPGRIAAHLVRGEVTDKPNGKGKRKIKPAADNADKGAAGAFKTDPNAPIDIDADQLDVNDTKKVAVFRGDVKAVQGDFVIKTPELVATYSGDIKLADVTAPAAEPAKPPAGQAAKKTSTELTHIRANTKVNVTSKDGQSVDGDWADYDAKAGTIVVGGEVVLSKGGSMVRGTRLVIDTVSGESTIETAPAQAVAVPGGGGWSTKEPIEGANANRGRPSAVFFPGELKQAQDDKKDKDKKKSAAPGAPDAQTPWQAQTAPSPSTAGTGLQPDN